MAYTDYTPTALQSITGASTTILRWNTVLAMIDGLIADPVCPYTCRGSSRNGSLGAAFSATPDGVNYWSGKTQTEVAGAGNPIWLVLQNSITGHQVVFLLGTASGPVSSILIAMSMNKFESAGAWRGGGSATGTRPTDTASSPITGRELATNAGTFTPQSTSNEYFNLFVRKDGNGFYCILFRDTTPDATADGLYCGYFKFSAPFTTDANPHLAFCTNNAATNAVLPFNTNTNGNFVGRLQDGTLQEHRSIFINDESSDGYLDRLSPWESGYAVHRIAFKSVTTKDIRYWMPDFYVCSGTTPASSTFATRDSKKSFRYSGQVGQQWGLIGPWNGSTVKGTDVPVYVFPAAEVTPTPVAPAGLTATAGNTQIELSWNVSSGAATYTLKRGTVNGGPYGTTVAAGLTTTHFTDTGLTNGTPYYYVVTATNTSGTSSDSSQATATPVAPVPPVVDTISPSNGSQLGGATAVTFHVTDLSPGLYKTYIWLQIAGEVSPRLVFDNTVFKTPFLTLSSRSVIANGYSYSLQFDGGWPGVVSSVTVAAIDLTGAATETTFGYIAVPPPPLVLQIVRAVDARVLEIVFNRGVVQSEAENIANYSISPSLSVLSSTRITDFNYRLTTSQQIIDQAYAVTISGINPL